MSSPRNPPDLTDVERHILLHSLGFQKVNGRWKRGGWRNYFTSGPDCDNYSTLIDLTKRGWLQTIRIEGSAPCTFSVTEPAIAVFKACGWPWVKDP